MLLSNHILLKFFPSCQQQRRSAKGCVISQLWLGKLPFAIDKAALPSEDATPLCARAGEQHPWPCQDKVGTEAGMLLLGKGLILPGASRLLLLLLRGEWDQRLPPPCLLPAQIGSVAPADLCPPWLKEEP